MRGSEDDGTHAAVPAACSPMARETSGAAMHPLSNTPYTRPDTQEEPGCLPLPSDINERMLFVLAFQTRSPPAHDVLIQYGSGDTKSCGEPVAYFCLQVDVAGNSEVWWKHAGSNVRRECHFISRRQVCVMHSILLMLTMTMINTISRPFIQVQQFHVLADTKTDFAGPVECFGAEAQGSPRIPRAVHQNSLPAAYI